MTTGNKKTAYMQHSSTNVVTLQLVKILYLIDVVEVQTEPQLSNRKKNKRTSMIHRFPRTQKIPSLTTGNSQNLLPIS
jgi:hypothetical protein